MVVHTSKPKSQRTGYAVTWPRRRRGDVRDSGRSMLPRMRRITSSGLSAERTCPVSRTDDRTCPTDRFPADMFLSMLRNFCPLKNDRLDKCPLENCPIGRTHDRTCPLKLVHRADRTIFRPTGQVSSGQLFLSMVRNMSAGSLSDGHVRSSVRLTGHVRSAQSPRMRQSNSTHAWKH